MVHTASATQSSRTDGLGVGSVDAWGGITGSQSTLLDDDTVSRPSASSCCDDTELDSLTDNSDLDVVEVVTIDQDTVPLGYDGLCHWRYLTNMEFHIAKVAQDRRILWRLPTVNNYREISHGIHIVQSVLAFGERDSKSDLLRSRTVDGPTHGTDTSPRDTLAWS